MLDHHSNDTTAIGPEAPPSPSAHLLDELQLHGYRPFADDPDPRPLPDPETAEAAIDAVFDALCEYASKSDPIAKVQ
jgi:hypothetical protein